MNLTRRYFILDTTQALPEDITEGLEMCIGDTTTQRYSLDETLLLVKTTQQTIDEVLIKYPLLTEQDILNDTFSTEYTLDQIKVIMNSVAWTDPNEII